LNVYLFTNFPILTATFTIIGWLIMLAMLFIVPVNRKPSSATAWLLLIFLLPYVGLIIFLLIGSPKLSRKRRAMQRTMNDIVHKSVEEDKQRADLAVVLNQAIPSRYQPFVQLNDQLGSMPAVPFNSVELLPDYLVAIARIAEEIDRAERYLYIEYFALSRDEDTEAVFSAMERAQQRGVRVCVLMDHLGSRKYPHFKEMRKKLLAADIEYHLSLPLHFFGSKYTRIDLRNHRKIVVIDGQVGFTGSQNMIKRNYFRKDAIYYDELVARVSGPVVRELEAAFLTDWYSETGVMLTHHIGEALYVPPVSDNILCQVLPSGPGFDNENNLRLFTGLIHASRQKLVITNPYFVPDDALMTAITSAAIRGVDVSLFNSEASDQFLVSHAQRSYYEQLFEAGVNIYWYQAPILLHSKHMTIDDDIAVIGSSNLDIRSFELNLEVTLICYDPKVVSQLREVEAVNLKKSRIVTIQEWKERSLRNRFFDGVARLTAALQ
jgi:cardiolipin synthase